VKKITFNIITDKGFKTISGYLIPKFIFGDDHAVHRSICIWGEWSVTNLETGFGYLCGSRKTLAEAIIATREYAAEKGKAKYLKAKIKAKRIIKKMGIFK